MSGPTVRSNVPSLARLYPMQSERRRNNSGETATGRAAASRLILAPLALRPVIREQCVQAMGFLKRCVDRPIHRRLIGTIEDDGKRRPHGIRASFHLLRRCCLHQKDRCELRRETNGSGLLPFGIWFFQKAS